MVDHPNKSQKFQLVRLEPQQLQRLELHDPDNILEVQNNEIVSRQMIAEINAECKKSDRLKVTKLNAVKQYNKQNHKFKLMTEKYSLLPLNPQQLTPVQTAIQRMSEKHPDFEIEPVNTIQPLEIEYTKMPEALVPIDTPLSII